MPIPRKTNLWPEAPENQFIYHYKGKSDRFVAYRRYEDPEFGKTPLNKYKRFNKACLFYSIEEAIDWLKKLPEIMYRSFRDNASIKCESTH